MHVENKLYPDEKQMAGFLEPDNGQPIYMLNLLKFKHKAEYKDGRETNLSGKEAYNMYAEGVETCLAKVGGSITFTAGINRLTIGNADDLWDEVVIVMYPSRTAMLQMMQLPEMAEISKHRKAGLAGQLNIETSLETSLESLNS
ncbi:DUF1330 domain-containing protein [Maricurvus nonylphenolicus]|uniref:DUF1330 domain-containing protein n=1 Tax=Maricurvus nonylphenolicus TaxID=1008307 RepID=UPI0036F39BE1